LGPLLFLFYINNLLKIVQYISLEMIQVWLTLIPVT
jgi:hypothetical protein